MTCQKVLVVSVFHFTLCDTGRRTSTSCTTWDWCAARVTVRHVDTIERADLVPVPLHVVIPLKLRANPGGSSWWTATNQEKKDGRMDRLGRGTATSQAREFGKTKCRVRKNRGDDTTASTNTVACAVAWVGTRSRHHAYLLCCVHSMRLTRVPFSFVLERI